MFTVYSNSRSHIEYKQASSFLPFTYYHLSKEDYKDLSQLWLILWVLRRSSPPSATHAHCTDTCYSLGRAASWGVASWLLKEWHTDSLPHSTCLAQPTPWLVLPLSFQLSCGYFMPPSSLGRTDGITGITWYHYSMAWMRAGLPIWPKLSQKQVHFLLIHSQSIMQKTWCERLCPWGIYVSQCQVFVCYSMLKTLIGLSKNMYAPNT